ncbi:hypothetical protein HOK51_08005 [Candidatus Woesearchaeota archaeon]|nr:hypothetical protein [Candidatus Woesearchaeota archaeon]MBT6519769.1 hypothetical protein [Candidatus Woesearchaeota archaeon]MBT7368148.1 hypothetical protein [Candidatus Woesearchaeota archaeon]
MTQQTNLSLKKLKGIKPKCVKTKSESRLSKLVVDCRDFVGECNSKELIHTMEWIRTNLDRHPKRKELFKKLNITQPDLENFIDIMSDLMLDCEESNYTGIYSGFLLDYLSEQERKKGQPSKFLFNGTGRSFNYLFANSKKIDRLILNNFKGDNVLYLAGRDLENPANYIYVNNLVGNQNIVSSGSTFIDLLVGTNCSGEGFMRGAGNLMGRIGLLVADNIKGNLALASVGGRGGNCAFTIATNIEGESTLADFCGNLGDSNFLYMENIEGPDILRKDEIERTFPGLNKPLDLVACKNVKFGSNEYRLDINNLVEYKKQKQKFNELKNKYRVEEILTKVRSIKTPDESTFDILDDLNNIYVNMYEQIPESKKKKQKIINNKK